MLLGTCKNVKHMKGMYFDELHVHAVVCDNHP